MDAFIDAHGFPAVALPPRDRSENREIVRVECLHTFHATEGLVAGAPVVSPVRRPRDDEKFGSIVDHNQRYREGGHGADGSVP
ncbi:reverse transcriptase, RNA-dependent DNA polymerase [Mycolicibacterium brisbanense]|uniref:Reverse transcriptase, RNA-dependent DNA polymerase n=1 Tax=Mycolicibacterium brisbanense TaxID=146020 RepID=A0A100W4J2_9MYCO|nr:reverse transcriptase, RNA-dependent DNA polymerase [Mycolicibacterium brisbanense]